MRRGSGSTLQLQLQLLFSMATVLNLSPIQTPPPSPRLFSFQSSQTTLHPSFTSHPTPLSLPSFSLKSYAPPKPRASVITSAVKSLSETKPVSVYGDEVAGKLPSGTGVYAIFDQNGELQFVGLSRNIAASVLTHRKSVPELCHSVKVGIVDQPDRKVLTEAWKSWMEEHIKATGKVPPGNESGNTNWVRQAPKKKKSDLRLTVPLEQLVDRLVKENKVVAFIKGSRNAPLCGFSQRVVGILENQGVEYESVDVLDEEYNSGLRETLKTYSNWPTFPQIFVNGELVGGCDILTSMHGKGELADFSKK